MGLIEEPVGGRGETHRSLVGAEGSWEGVEPTPLRPEAPNNASPAAKPQRVWIALADSRPRIDCAVLQEAAIPPL